MNGKAVLSIAFVILLSATIDHAYSSDFVVNINTGGPYSIEINNVTWLQSGDTAFRNAGSTYTTADGSLKLLNTTMESGKDKVGLWQSTNFTYQAGSLFVMTSIKMYVSDPNLPLVIFTQKYLGNAEAPSAFIPEFTISKFPSFKLQAPSVDLGYMVYSDLLAVEPLLVTARFDKDAIVPTGMNGGPVVLFDNSNNAMVISPMSQFFAASTSLDITKQINWGIMGMVDSVPQDYTIDFIVYFSDQGINKAVKGWGDFVTKLYNKNSAVRDNDPTLKYVGYWTDRGAYYYYNTEPGKDYEQTVLDVDSYFTKLGIPFNYLQFDSWWYLKGNKGGAKTWAPTHDTFPDGFNYVYQKTKLPFGGHNKFWASDTTYATANGGKYNFIIDNATGYAVPDDDRFWPDLFNSTRAWGRFILYEQDWLNKETSNNPVLMSDLFMGRRWLMQMGSGAQEHGITIQYCGALPRHILQAIEIPAVTQARVSLDYNPGGRQWNIGIMALMSDAVQIAPYKDTFWTTENEPGSPYKDVKETAPALNHLIATLSTGPVGPGDGIGFINQSLVMRCCDATGLILKPSKPITAINDQIKRLAFQTYPGPDGEVYTTYSNHTNLIFGTVLAADMKNEYSLTPSSGWTGVNLYNNLYVYSGLDSKIPVPFSESEPIKLGPECTTTNFCLYYVSPMISLANVDYVNIVLMGEPDKWVPLSNQRISQIYSISDDVLVVLRVQAKEIVTFNYWNKGDASITTLKCDNSKGEKPVEQARISTINKYCSLGS